jgi:hypothetical protein
VSKETWNVLQQAPSGSHFANDSDGLGPHVSVVVLSSLGSGDTEGLAWESRSDDIHKATPGPRIKGSDVVPDREQGKHAVSLPAEKHLPAVGVDFDRAYGSPSEEMGSEEAPTSSGK